RNAMTLPPNWPAMSIKDATAALTAPGARFEMETVVIRGIPTRVWKNCPPTNKEVFLAGRMYGDREFLVYEADRCTYETFARATLKLAARLQADGVKKGDRVAIIMCNLPEWVVAFYAAELVGAIVTPLNAWWTGPELEYGLVDSGTKVAFVDSERLGRVNDWGKLPPGEMPKVELDAEDDATILYTSGTTGRPKGALGTHRNMTSN